MESDQKVQHWPRHFKLHVERQRLHLLLQVHPDVRGGVDDGEKVTSGQEAGQLDGLGLLIDGDVDVGGDLTVDFAGLSDSETGLTPQNTLHLDSFLYDEADEDMMIENGELSRSFCKGNQHDRN